MTTNTPTAEQQAIIDAYRRGEDIVGNAYAGTGKTSTLRMLVASDPRKVFTYVAYNKSAKLDADATFPKNAKCYTSHGLAYRPMITMAKRIGASKYTPGTELAKLMKINGPARLTDDKVLAPGQVANVVKATIKKFCYSADEHIGRHHVPNDLKRFTEDEIAALRTFIPAIAHRVWKDITSDDGQVPMDFDYYLKAFALTHPVLPGDVIALDEAQDSNPCVAAMVLEQRKYGKQVIMVGDTYQAIYGWRGARDAMIGFAKEPGVTVLSLTQSFRFGEAIAAEGNKLLQILGAPKPLRGFEKITSRVGAIPGAAPDAILCRTNAEAMRQAIDAIGRGLTVAFPKGAGELIGLVKGARDIKAGRPSEHPDLLAFTTWGQVQDFAENEPDGQDLKRFVDLVDQHGVDDLLGILFQIRDGSKKGTRADITISTAHSAKGREWRLVEIAGDFLEPKADPSLPEGTLPVIPREMAMLLYVALTRAQHVLDCEAVAWINDYLPGAVAAPEPVAEVTPVPVQGGGMMPELDLTVPALAKAMSLALI